MPQPNRDFRVHHLATTALLLSIAGVTYGQSDTGKLDIRAYLKNAIPGQISPSPEQLEMLKRVVPDKPFQAAPAINDRAFWDEIAASETGKRWMAQADQMLPAAPEVPITDDVYRAANEAGNRGAYKPRYYRTMERLERFTLAECMENKGRFLPQIETHVRAIMSMKSWMHPNHDGDNAVLEGKRMRIDLGARKFGSDFALAETLLGDKLSGELRQQMDGEMRRRIIEPYLKSTLAGEKDTENTWIVGSSNWNSVCTSGSTYVTIAASKNADERLRAVGSAINSMAYFVKGFGEDGYCSEGIGYWGYGFGHYLYLAQILSDYTGGAIDLFAFDNPEKLKKVANFPNNFQIQNGVYPAFSDSSITTPEDFGNFAKAMTAKHYGTTWPFETIHEQAMEQLIQWTAPLGDGRGSKPSLPMATYLDDSGIVLSRGQQATPFSIAIKAGNNGENHNHNDVGSYSLILGTDLVAGDIGKPVYIAGAFSPDNKARSSWGHPVPRIAGKLQSTGAKYAGRVEKADLTSGQDVATLDLKGAYSVPDLKSLQRVMTNERAGAGRISIQDSFETSKPISFGTAIMTYSPHEVVDANTLLLTVGERKVKVTLDAGGAALKITPEPVPVRLGSGKQATRIGVDLVEPAARGSIKVTYTPVSSPESK